MSGIGIFNSVEGIPLQFDMDGVHKQSWGSGIDNLKVKEASGGHIGITMDGAANVIYGPQLAQLAYAQCNALGVLGQIPYSMGQRVESKLAVDPSDSASSVRGGAVPPGVRAEYVLIETPHKVCTTTQIMELGMTNIGDRGTDDVVLWEKTIMNHGQGFLNNMDNMILARIEDAPTVGKNALPTQQKESTQRTGLESLERIYSNADEARFLPDTYAVPWYNDADNGVAQGSSMMGKFRSQDSYDTLGFNASSHDPMGGNVIHKYRDGTVTGQAGDYTTLSQNTLSALYNKCAPWWSNNSTNGKAFVTGFDTLEKLQSQSNAQQRFLNTEYAALGINGINSIEGRDIGFQVASYAGIPIIPDLMAKRGDVDNPTKGVGRVLLLDLDHVKRSTLLDMNIMVTDNRLIAQSFNRIGNFLFMGEVVTTKFKSGGKAIHIA